MKLLLFDIDGTLVRVRHDVLAGVLRSICRDVLGDAGHADNMELHGKTDRLIMLELCSRAGITGSDAARLCSRMERALLEQWEMHLDAETVELLPGVRELVERLAERPGICLALLTGNLEPAARMKLAPHDLNGFFPFGAYGSDAVNRNDLPPIALERAHAHAAHRFTYQATVIIGDSHRDIGCARAWGIRSLAVATGSLTEEELLGHEPDVVWPSLADTERIVEWIEQG
ncbi:MAG TPA: HAD hydrolase-like protein [Candidatus Kapabacteria bacterium]|nr:HAD hydrolase-like protein [Candidatus Kapabacteria bacterium]